MTSSPTQTRAPALAAWLDDFLVSYYRHRPVSATFIGIHAHDERLTDLSEDGVGDALAEAESLVARLRTLPHEDASDTAVLDRTLARGSLQIQRWELGSDHHRGNPSLYTGEAAFGVIGLLRRPFAALERRVEAARHRIDAIPALLEAAPPHVRGAPEAWLDRADGECQGLLALLGDGLDRFLADAGVSAAPLRAAADRAIPAVAAFQRHLQDARGRATRGLGCGPDAFALLLQEGHFLSADATEIARLAADQLAESEAQLRACASALGAHTWQDALAMLADRHPSVGDYYARYDECWMACHRLAREHRLLTWPDFPIRYVPRPAWVREAARHLYFLSYHSPAPFDDVLEVEYLVTPIEPSMRPADLDGLLRATNDSVIKLNHVVHHGAIGHHVQNWYAMRAPSRIGRIAGVDCASRIALLCGGTMTEGWACYATELMDEVGFVTPLERLAVRHGRLRMAARALVDVGLHTRDWTLDQAVTFYREQVGMTEAAARAEVVKNSMFPATALMYLVGTDAILQLRRELAARPGFTLAAFHDRLLSCGSIPVSLAAAALRAEGRALAGEEAGDRPPEDR